jgi:hypothetical protein
MLERESTLRQVTSVTVRQQEDTRSVQRNMRGTLQDGKTQREVHSRLTPQVNPHFRESILSHAMEIEKR